MRPAFLRASTRPSRRASSSIAGAPFGRQVGRLLRVAAVCALVPAAGCFTSDEGVAPPPEGFYFPTGLAVSPGGTTLYVANSDFDLRYNGGTVQALDLDAIRKDVLDLRFFLEADRPPEEGGGGEGTGGSCGLGGLGSGAGDSPCEKSKLLTNQNPILAPGPCEAFPPAGVDGEQKWLPGDERGYIKASVSIGAFASGMAIVTDPGETVARLFVPVRGDPSVTFIDVRHDRLDAAGFNPCGTAAFCLRCQETGDDQRCGSAHRIGEQAGLNKRGLVLPVEPVGMAVGPTVELTDGPGNPVVVAHQTTAQASLILNEFGKAPTLEFPLSNLPAGPTEVASLPMPAFAVARAAAAKLGDGAPFDYGASFLITFRAAPEVDLLRFNADQGSAPDRPFLTRAFAEGINVDSNGSDSRGIAVDGSQRKACEDDCVGDLDCLRDCMDVPLRVFIGNRSPATLIVGEVKTEVVESDEGEPTGAFDTVNIYDAVPLAFGASKVSLGNVIDEDGIKRLRVFAVAFDSRLVFTYDPETRRVESIIHTGRGPHAIAIDSGAEGCNDYALLYVGHFTDSYIGVVDLDMRHRRTFGQMFASIGNPQPPKELR